MDSDSYIYKTEHFSIEEYTNTHTYICRIYVFKIHDFQKKIRTIDTYYKKNENKDM